MSDEEFDAVAEISAALRRTDSRDTYTLIVSSDPVRNYYVQCAYTGHPESLYCEAVSDNNLEPADQLGEFGATRLRLLGWRDPRKRRDNWSRKFPLHGDDDFGRIAATLVQTLREVYGYEGGALEMRIV